MSLKSEAIWAPAPSTERGRGTQLSSDPKGERLAYANNKSIFLRSIDHPAQSTQYTQHTANTTVARFSPSGYYVASGDVAGNVKIWDCIGEGATKGSYQIIRSVTDLAWDGDSQRIIAVGDGKERFGHCFTADSGNSVGEITGHTGPLNTVSVRQQRPIRAAIAGDDTNLIFYNGVPFKFNKLLREQHTRFVYGTAFSPNGDLLVSVGADKQIWLYDGKTGDPKGSIGTGAHSGSIFSVSWSSDSKRFVTASADQTVRIWDAHAEKEVQSWRLGDAGGVSVPHQQVGVVWPTARSDDLVISLSLSGDLNYLQPGQASPRQIVRGHQRNVTAVAATPSTKTLWTGSAEGRVFAWDAATGKAEDVDGTGHGNYVTSLTATDKNAIASTGWDDTLRIIDASTRTFTGVSAALDGQPRRAVEARASGSDSKPVLVTATHKGIEVFTDGARVSEISTKYTPACITAHGSTVVVGGDDNTFHVYALSPKSKLEPHSTVSQPGALPTSLAFSPDGSLLAAGFANGKIIVFTVTIDSTSAQSSNPSNSSSAAAGQTGTEWPVAISRWSAHTGRVTSLAWRADGQYAVSGALDTHVYVWSVEQPGRRISAMGAHKEGVNGVAWESESRVVSVGMDAAVKIWGVVLGR